MNAKQHFRATMAARRAHARGTPEHGYLTAAARKLAWLARGVPASEWTQ